MEQIKRIVFVAEMRNPKTGASSTQIMTRNLLVGFNRLADEVIFVPVVLNESDESDIAFYYSSLCTKMYFSREKTKYKNHVVLRQFSWLYRTIFFPHNVIPDGLLDDIDKNTVLISQSPPIDAAVLCASIRQRKRDVRYVQYWGDPLALSLITPSEYYFKRFLLKTIEKRLHQMADSVVYGTKSLYNAESALFPALRSKASCCRVSYMPDAKETTMRNTPLRFGYFGNYYSKIRNIKPLYEAFLDIKDAELVICGASDIQLDSTENITVRNRIPQSEVEEQESRLDVEICILNTVGIQIPGKIFYHTKTSKKILVILDGPNKDNIKQELSESNRFIFCENNKVDISCVIQQIINGTIDNTDYDPEFYSPETVCKQILCLQ